MANSTIYPYGTGGSLPTGYPIINDLTTGGADKALSAEMGKELAPVTEIIGSVTHPETTTAVATTTGGRYLGNMYNTATTGAFDTSLNSNSGWAYAAIDVEEGDVITAIGTKPGADYRIYTICDASGNRIAIGPNTSNQSYTSENPLVVTMPEGAAKFYLNMSKDNIAVTITKAEYSEDTLLRATTTQDGIMTMEQVAALNAAGGADVNLLKSYVTDRTDIINGTFETGSLKNYGVNVGTTYHGGVVEAANDTVFCELPVLAGDIVTLWSTTNAWTQAYVICDADDTVVAKSGNWQTITQADPVVLNIAQDGKVWISSLKANDYGASISRTYRAFRNATAEQDGLMPKEIAALFGGDVSGDDAASLKLKSFAFIGDSFSAPGSWQSTMCSILGAMLKKNKAVSGGAWHGTDSLSAYAQAQALVTDAANPDYILCLLGTNDIAHWDTYTLGDIADSETIGAASGNVNPSGSITGGIQATLITLKRAYPNAIIKIGYTPAGQLHDSFAQRANVEALCQRLKEVGILYGVDYIETRTCGISRALTEDRLAWEGNTEGASYTGHPSGEGQTRIGQYMARKMLSNL